MSPVWDQFPILQESHDITDLILPLRHRQKISAQFFFLNKFLKDKVILKVENRPNFPYKNHFK